MFQNKKTLETLLHQFSKGLLYGKFKCSRKVKEDEIIIKINLSHWNTFWNNFF